MGLFDRSKIKAAADESEAKRNAAAELLTQRTMAENRKAEIRNEFKEYIAQAVDEFLHTAEEMNVPVIQKEVYKEGSYREDPNMIHVFKTEAKDVRLLEFPVRYRFKRDRLAAEGICGRFALAETEGEELLPFVLDEEEILRTDLRKLYIDLEGRVLMPHKKMMQFDKEQLKTVYALVPLDRETTDSLLAALYLQREFRRKKKTVEEVDDAYFKARETFRTAMEKALQNAYTK